MTDKIQQVGTYDVHQACRRYRKHMLVAIFWTIALTVLTTAVLALSIGSKLLYLIGCWTCPMLDACEQIYKARKRMKIEHHDIIKSISKSGHISYDELLVQIDLLGLSIPISEKTYLAYKAEWKRW